MREYSDNLLILGISFIDTFVTGIIEFSLSAGVVSLNTQTLKKMRDTTHIKARDIVLDD